MGFAGVRELINAEEAGQYNIFSFRKVPSQASTAGVWFDLSMASGNPSPNFYSGTELTATVLEGYKGLGHGASVLPKQKYLTETLTMTTTANAVPLTMTMCDYLLFYPQIDMDSVDTQYTDNTVTLPRYTDGRGVQMFLVAQYPYLGGVDFTITYTNSDGVTGRSTGLVRANTAGNIGSFVHSGVGIAGSYGCFLPLQSGDVGVRAVESITFSAPNGGLGAIVLVKPLDTTIIRETTAPVECNYYMDEANLSEIKDGAFLNYICCATTGSVAGAPIIGTIKTTFN